MAINSPDPAGQPAPQPSTEDLRRMSQEELLKLAEDGLASHLAEAATFAHLKYGGLKAEQIETFLVDPECLRYPTRVAYEFGEMGFHQFGQPVMDHRDPDQLGRILYLRPALRDRPDLLPLAVAYLVPLINYGDVVTDEQCLLYGATLLGLMKEDYYQRVCQMADIAGSDTLYPGEGGGGGCGCG